MMEKPAINRAIGLHEYVVMNTMVTHLDDCDIDIVFFKVNVLGGDADTLRSLVRYWHGTFGNPELSLLNGDVFNFIEIGAWLGDQETALRMMAMGAHLDVWRLITPRDCFVNSNDLGAFLALAKTGMIAIVVESVK